MNRGLLPYAQNFAAVRCAMRALLTARCTTRKTRALYSDSARSRALNDRMLEPCDGEVTKPSLLARQSLDPTESRSDDVFFPLAYAFFLCVDHEHLAGNINFQDNLLNVLLERGRPWENPGPAPADLGQKN